MRRRYDPAVAGGAQMAEDGPNRRRVVLGRGLGVVATVGAAATAGILLWGSERAEERAPTCDDIAIALEEELADPRRMDENDVLVDAGLRHEMRTLRVSYAELVRGASSGQRAHLERGWAAGVDDLADDLLDEVGCPPLRAR